MSFRRLWQFVKRQVVDDAPEDLALCEFDCRKEQCRQDEWETCGRRIRKGSGELFPDGGLKPTPPADLQILVARASDREAKRKITAE
jgi:hypothetical protein